MRLSMFAGGLHFKRSRCPGANLYFTPETFLGWLRIKLTAYRFRKVVYGVLKLIVVCLDFLPGLRKPPGMTAKYHHRVEIEQAQS